MSVQEYEKAEWDITLNSVFQNPYNQQEVSLDLVLTASNGLPVVVPGCCEQNAAPQSRWKVRFAPQMLGAYTGLFRLTKRRVQKSRQPVPSR